MFVSAIKKAHHAVEGIAYEAALGLAAVMLGCAAVVFAAGGLAIWLTNIMPVFAAVFIAALIVAFVAVIAFQLSQLEPAKKNEKPERSTPESSLGAMTKSLSSLAGPMDVMASGLFARQFKKAPVSTIAATAAVGALLGVFASSADDD